MLNLPFNIYLVAFTMAMNFCAVAMMILIAGLIGAELAPAKNLATLPIAAMVVGTAIATIPAALWMQKVGRRFGLQSGIALAVCAMVCCYFAVANQHFTLLVLGSLLVGCNAAFTQQGRFVILENANNEQQQADGLTLALLANLFAAFAGPWIGTYGKDLIQSAEFAGSFILLGGILVLALCSISFLRDRESTEQAHSGEQRSLSSIAAQPLFIIAAGSAAIGYGVMSLIMTGTPVSMVEIDAHSIENTRWVIQSHIAAMFLPSLLSGYLLKRGLSQSLLMAGLVCYLIVTVIGFSGQHVHHYWWALLMLGIGWNFLFITATSLLPKTYNDAERFKTQAMNDFLVFGFQAVAAFSAGWLIFQIGWLGIITTALILTALWLVIVAILFNRHSKSTQ